MDAAMREHLFSTHDTPTEGRRPAQAQGRVWPARHDHAVRPEVRFTAKAGCVPGYFELRDVAMEVHEVAGKAWAIDQALELARCAVRVGDRRKAQVRGQLRSHHRSIREH